MDVAHILDEEGQVKPEWRDRLSAYLQEVSAELTRRRATALILGCTDFEYFEREFGRLLPTLAARNGIVGPSGALAWTLMDAFDEHVRPHPVRPIAPGRGSYFAFSGDRPADATSSRWGWSGSCWPSTCSPLGQ